MSFSLLTWIRNALFKRLVPMAYGLGTSNHKTIDIFILTLDPTCMNRLHFFSINTRAKQMDTRKCKMVEYTKRGR